MQRALNECGLALAALRPMMSSSNTDPTNPPNPSEFLPHPLGGGHAPRTPSTSGKRTGARHGPVFPPSLPVPQAGHTMDRAKGAAKHAGPTGSPLTTGTLSRLRQERYFPGRGVKGCVHHWSRRTPPPRKVKRQGNRSQNTHNDAAGGASAHPTCENGARDTLLAAQKANSVKEREGSLHSDQDSFFPPDRYPEQAGGQEPEARRLLRANTGVLRRAQRAAPDGMPRHQSMSHPNLRELH